MSKFKIKAEYKPAGDQPNAIKELVAGLEKGLEKADSFWRYWLRKDFYGCKCY